jgi:hypothetical protein
MMALQAPHDRRLLGIRVETHEEAILQKRLMRSGKNQRHLAMAWSCCDGRLLLSLLGMPWAASSDPAMGGGVEAADQPSFVYTPQFKSTRPGTTPLKPFTTTVFALRTLSSSRLSF